ncbi:uncharacterized protein LOC111249249 isoform X2 [Varroa destructor]|uniref:Uncharacterized protein n=1 Tax=Varroa destructor TaxID=109461 RepID=A0A7M7MFT0_VARDE|nr:uncharacterized protein LOC111249249 isoform X2 [Varroa destructor]
MKIRRCISKNKTEYLAETYTPLADAKRPLSLVPLLTGHVRREQGESITADVFKNRSTSKHPSIFSFRRYLIAICLLCIAFLGLYFTLHHDGLDLRTAVGLPAYFNITYRIVIGGLQVDTNLATLQLVNNTRALFFSAGNTIVCARIDADHLVWKRTLIHKVEYVQCNDAVCVFYGNRTITALEPNNGGFLWTSRVKARPFLMTTSWGSRIVVFHNEYMIIYRQDTGSSMTHFRIKNCSRINYIQPIGVRLAVFCQHNINLSSISLYIIPKSVLLHFTPQTQDKPISADFVGYFKLPVRVHTYNDTVLYILHDRGVVSTLSVTERRVEDILNISADVREVLPINCTHTLVQTPSQLLIYSERGAVWRKPIVDEHITYIRRLSHNLILLKKNLNQLAILDIALIKEFKVDFGSYQELLLVEGKDHTLFTASVAQHNATIIRTIRYHD